MDENKMKETTIAFTDDELEALKRAVEIAAYRNPYGGGQSSFSDANPADFAKRIAALWARLRQLE